MIKNYLLFLFALTFATTYSQFGTLDTSFGNNGVITTSISGTFNFSSATIVQADGKIVVVGHAGEPATYMAAAARYNVDGTLDTSFGNAGTLIIPVGSDKSFATDLAQQNDGKIVIGARTWDNTSGDFALVRLNTDGTLDTTFGTNGITIGDNGNDVAETVAIQDDGKIVLGGYTDDNFSVARFNTDGTIDTSFGTNGWSITEFDTSVSFIKEIGIQADGKIVMAGFTFNTNNSYQMAAARLNIDGTIDATFGTNGKVFFNVGNDNDFLEGMAIQTDGKILLGGHTYVGTNPLRYDMAVIRINTDGSFDNTYGTNGVAIARIVDEANYVRRMNLQSNGKVILAGFTVLGTEYDMAMARFNTDGTLDSSFGANGMVRTDIDGREDYGTSVAFQPDNKIILAGYSYTTSGDGEIVVARYTNELLHVSETNILEFKVFPNPATDYISINLEENLDTYQIEITDVRGRSVYVSEAQQNNRIDVSAFSSGTYLIKIKSNTQNGAIRFVKQ